MFFLIIPVNSR